MLIYFIVSLGVCVSIQSFKKCVATIQIICTWTAAMQIHIIFFHSFIHWFKWCHLHAILFPSIWAMLQTQLLRMSASELVGVNVFLFVFLRKMECILIKWSETSEEKGVQWLFILLVHNIRFHGILFAEHNLILQLVNPISGFIVFFILSVIVYRKFYYVLCV